MKRALVLLLLAFVALVAPSASAHARSVSYSTFELHPGGASVRLRLSLLDANLLESEGITREALPVYAASSLTLASRDGACTLEPGTLHALESNASSVELEWRLTCPSSNGLELTSRLIVEYDATHLHFARVISPARPEGVELVLDATHRSAAFPRAEEAPPAAGGFASFVELGVRHIWSGWDHLVFVFVLVLGGTTLRRTALVVTGFTLGHSVTLGLATLGVVVSHPGPVEAAIGVSIALLALENAWLARGRSSGALPVAGVGALALVALVAFAAGKPSALCLVGLSLFAGCYFAALSRAARPDVARITVAALFGLVHGLGFARVLSEMCLPRTHLARALVGFNLGVEAGQIAFVALAWPIVCLLRTQPDMRQSALVSAGSAMALSLGTYWFVLRAFS